jgi:hypothetical protein
MKRKPIGLQKKLFLNKETIASLNSHAQLRVRGGDLVQGPVNTSYDYRQCTTTIEVFRLSLEIQCAETESPVFCRTRPSVDLICPVGLGG